MKKTLSCLLVLALILSLSLSALADDQKMIIAGSARISIPADMASVELGANAKGQTVQEAQQLTDEIMSKVLAVLKNLGIDEKDIITSNYSVYTEVPYEEYGSIKKQEPIYNMTNIINIKLYNIEQVSQVIDESTKAGANQIYGLTFGSSKQGEAYNEALQKAVEDAMQKATVIAAATGKTLGELVEIETDRDYGGEYWGVGNVIEYNGGSMAKDAIVSGAITVSASVTLTYLFQ